MANINDKVLNGYSNWTPTQSYLAMSTLALNQFWVKANSSSIIDSITKGFTQPLNYINFIRVYPFNIMGRTYEETNVPVQIANKFIDVPNNRTDAILKESHVGNAITQIHKTYTFNFGSRTTFTDYEPYTTCECFLPYVGFITLTPSELLGIIQIDLIIDVISGNGTYCISRGGHVIYTVQTNFSVDIAIGGTNNIEQFKAQFNNGLNTLMGIGMTALGLGTGNTYMAAQGLSSSINSITNIPNSNTGHMIKRGTLGNYSTNFNNPHSIYFIFKKKNINDYDGFIETYGKPLNRNVKLSMLQGMTYIPNPKMEIPNLTSDEYDKLRSVLKNGIIIDSSLNVSNVQLKGSYSLMDKIQLTKVKLKGTYEDYKVKVSNILLKGRYNLMDKMSVSNVKLIGTYKASRVRVKNVKLKGRYNLQDKLSVSNVNLIGTYKASRVRVSNVLLKGLYKIQDKLSVSNVSLKGTYEEYKINVSNVALSGNYTLQPKISVSNVGLSGTYTEEVYYFITSDNLILTTSDNKYFIPKEDS